MESALPLCTICVFFYPAAVETSRAALENESFETALESAIDAMLLATWRSERQLEEERRRVETLATLCHRDAAEMEALVRSRTATLQKAADHVALSQARQLSTPRTGDAAVLALRGQGSRSNLLQRANELRTIGLFRHFADDQLIVLAKLLELQPFAHDEVIFREGQEGRDLFIGRASTVHVSRKTPIGNQVLTTFGFGSLFGEVSFLDRLDRTATAVGVGAGSVYRIPSAALEEALRRSPEFAVSLLWSFWQTLAEKIRSVTYQVGGGYGGSNAWRLRPYGDRGNEVNMGWIGTATDIPMRSANSMFVGHLLYVSAGMVDKMARYPTGGKMLDVRMHEGTGGPFTRQIVAWRYYDVPDIGGAADTGATGVVPMLIKGGAGGIFVRQIGPRQFDLRNYVNQWIWFEYEFNSTEGYTAMWIKTQDGVFTGAQNAPVMKREVNNPAHWRDRYGWNESPYEYTTLGWRGSYSVWGYWDDLSGVPFTNDDFVMLDNLIVSNSWINPPF